MRFGDSRDRDRLRVEERVDLSEWPRERCDVPCSVCEAYENVERDEPRLGDSRSVGHDHERVHFHLCDVLRHELRREFEDRREEFADPIHVHQWWLAAESGRE